MDCGLWRLRAWARRWAGKPSDGAARARELHRSPASLRLTQPSLVADTTAINSICTQRSGMYCTVQVRPCQRPLEGWMDHGWIMDHGWHDKLKLFRVRLRTIGAFSFLEHISQSQFFMQKLNALLGLRDLFRDRVHACCIAERTHNTGRPLQLREKERGAPNIEQYNTILFESSSSPTVPSQIRRRPAHLEELLHVG